MRKKLVAALLATLFISYAAIAQVRTQNTDRAHDHSNHQMKMTGDMSKDMKMMNEMMVKHLGKSDAEYDKRLIDMMIPHHEGAIMMFKDAVKNSKHEEIKEMAKKAIKEQEKDIEQLKSWRQEWYGSHSPGNAPE